MVLFSPSFLSSQTPAGRGGWPPLLNLVLPEVSLDWIILKLINFISLAYDYNELNSNWLELDYII